VCRRGASGRNTWGTSTSLAVSEVCTSIPTTRVSPSSLGFNAPPPPVPLNDPKYRTLTLPMAVGLFDSIYTQ
jgi:hypothetical protein